MTEKRKTSKIAIVAGDITIDWNLARKSQKKWGLSVWNPNDSIDMSWQRGGAALLADLLVQVNSDFLKEKSVSVPIRQPALPSTSIEIIPGDPNYHHSFTIWSERKYAEKSPLDKEKVWRVDEFLGMQSAKSPCPVMKVDGDSVDADLVILDDANLGFRDTPACWPLAMNESRKQSPWFVLKMAKPVAQGPLWEHLHRENADRLVVITTINDLRLSEVQISRSLSWERTAQDTFWEMIHNPCVNGLSHCAHVIISFGGAGAILLSRQKKNSPKCTLFFDPNFIEGSWERNYPGRVVGYTTCLTAGVVRQLMLDSANPDIATGIQSGLTALRNLHENGYEEEGKPLAYAHLVFPIKRVAACLKQKEKMFAMIEVQDPLRFVKQPTEKDGNLLTPRFWTILESRYQGVLEQVAEQIVRTGPKATLQDVPIGCFGNLITVDRREIEGFRSIQSLISEYCQKAKQKRPLSIAAFGAPGSGKSFGITEIARSLLPGQIETLEFNLSQFTSVQDLISALHQIRDIGLMGKIPLVFWDEFDTTMDGKPLGWLRYFLSPMQDGHFQDGQISHPIGRCIFVFAGGTAYSMAEFGGGMAVENFKAVKGPDFVSRLRGYVNILGPNPIQGNADSPAEDPFFIIRRAILLWSILKLNAPELFEKDVLNIDPGVLRAMIKTREYRHGIRSIESIIAMSQLAGRESFEQSSLPSEQQLDLHVDGQNFLSLVQQVELSGKLLEDLAEAAHEIYREGLKSRGDKTYASSLAYADLPEDLKIQNRQNVRDIPNKLVSVGLAMIPAKSNEPAFTFPGDTLNQLAKMEHERWMRDKLTNDWKYTRKTNKDRKLNQALLPWDKLPENEKEKDRDLVRGIPEILSRAGYTIAKMHTTK